MTRKTAGASASGPRGRSTASDGSGTAAVVRGASRGFTVLVVGGLLTPVVAAVVPALTQWWILLVAAVAFALAGAMVRTTERPALHGAVAATGSLTLLVPLWLLARGDSSPIQMLLTLLMALVVGSLSGAFFGRGAPPAGARP